MIPDIRSPPFPTLTRAERPRERKTPGKSPACRGLAELPRDEGSDPTTEVLGHLLGLGLSEHPDQRFCARGADEHAAAAVQLRVEALRLGQRSRRHLRTGDAH